MASIRGMAGGDLWSAIDAMAASDPNVARIVQQYKQVSPKEAFRSIGYDLDEISSITGS